MRPVMVKGRSGKQQSRKKPRADSTINRYLDAVSAVFTYGFDVCRPRLVAEKLPITKFEEVEGRLHWLEEDQQAAVYRWLKAQGHDLIATTVRFLILTGLRSGEFQKLAPEQIRHDHVILYATQTKGKAYREVFIAPEFAREMRAIVATGQRPVAYKLARTLKRAYHSLGYAPELCVHSLRHTCAAMMIDRGVNIRDVQVVLGHKSVETTERYAKVRRERLRETAQKLHGTAWDIAPEPSAKPATGR